MLKYINNDEAKHLEGYAAALQDILYQLTGDNSNSKSYDPMKVDGETIHSYAFNLKSGGRHHRVGDFESVEEIKKIMLEEVAEEIIFDFGDN